MKKSKNSKISTKKKYKFVFCGNKWVKFRPHCSFKLQIFTVNCLKCSAEEAKIIRYSVLEV